MPLPVSSGTMFADNFFVQPLRGTESGGVSVSNVPDVTVSAGNTQVAADAQARNARAEDGVARGVGEFFSFQVSKQFGIGNLVNSSV